MTPNNDSGESTPKPDAPEQGIQIPPTPDFNPNSDIQSFADAPTESPQPEVKPAEAATTEPAATKKSKKPLIIGVIVAVIVITLVVLGLVFLPKLFSKTDTAAYDEVALFVEESNGSNTFAIYNVDGTMVSGFIYSNVSHFYGGHAAACLREDNQKCGVVSAAGTISVPFGEYSSLESVGGLYLVTKADRRYLINYANKRLEAFNTDDNSSTLKLFTTDERIPFVIYNYDGGKYRLYNDGGELVKDFESKVKPTLLYSTELGKSFLLAEKVIYLLDQDQKTISKTFETNKSYNSLINTSYSGQVGLFGNDSNKDSALYRNDTITELETGDCDQVRLASDKDGRYFEYAICHSGYSNDAFDYDGNKIGSVGVNPRYYSPDTYAEDELTKGRAGVNFYRNGSITAETLLDGRYHVDSAFATGQYRVADYDHLGECIFNLYGDELTCQKFDDAHVFNEISDVDDNKLVIVKSGSTHEYWLKTLTGETKIGPKSGIANYGPIYLVADEETIFTNDGYGYWNNAYGAMYLTDEKGQPILDAKMRYDEITAIDKETLYAHDHYRFVNEIISVKDRKVLLAVKDGQVIERYRNYVVVKNGDRSTYYRPGTYEKIFAQ